MHDPSLNHRRPRFGCFCGTFNRSNFHIRSTRFLFTFQPSLFNNPVTLRYPYLPYKLASSITRMVSFSLNLFSLGSYRCVDLWCPKTRQALRCETFNPFTTCSTASVRLVGLRSFPWILPLKSHCLNSSLQPAFLNDHSRVLDL